MIENEDQYNQSLKVLERLELALGALRRRIEPMNPDLFQAMAQTYITEINEIRGEIDDYIGLSKASEYQAQLWFSLEGEELRASEISTKLLIDWLSKFRHAVQNVAEYLQNKRTILGRPSASIISMTDPKLVTIRSGSIKIGLKFPVPFTQGELFSEDTLNKPPLSHKAVERILQLVDWVNSTEQELPSDKFPDEIETSILANEVISLVPSRRSTVSVLRFSGALVPTDKTLLINIESRSKIQKIIDMLTITHIDTFIGVIREIDLDAPRIILRERGPSFPDLKCYLTENLVELAESLLNKLVKVEGKVTSTSPEIIYALSIIEMGGE